MDYANLDLYTRTPLNSEDIDKTLIDFLLVIILLRIKMESNISNNHNEATYSDEPPTYESIGNIIYS